ncbi:hypothetical protein GCM10010329_80540 [Streptomyces spiroverticillatus]|uniref:Uncharacterized protein n=1 Tax=Streptomyces finlayi TaxID=67296 RepID=A0A919CEY3_9ACTN|nr:hypothetical protein [Streptomyces finlayi]GHA45880.1 hypothetical protein GCM10010329_80540 [Streptomyces spiroverticillatus]GHD15931.1 hypothetical protein GCM10010334_76460 [Streptomyces finlayi]
MAPTVTLSRASRCRHCGDRDATVLSEVPMGEARALPLADDRAAAAGDGAHIHADPSSDRFQVVRPL